MSGIQNEMDVLAASIQAFRSRRRNFREGYPDQIRQSVLSLLKNGADIKFLGKQTGLHTEVIKRWVHAQTHQKKEGPVRTKVRDETIRVLDVLRDDHRTLLGAQSAVATSNRFKLGLGFIIGRRNFELVFALQSSIR